MPARKKGGHRLKVKIKILSATKLALAVAFLGVAALTLAAVVTFQGRNETTPVGMWCAYASQIYDSGLGDGIINYCGAVQNAKDCRDLFKGMPLKTIDECTNYLSSLSK